MSLIIGFFFFVLFRSPATRAVGILLSSNLQVLHVHNIAVKCYDRDAGNYDDRYISRRDYIRFHDFFFKILLIEINPFLYNFFRRGSTWINLIFKAKQ